MISIKQQTFQKGSLPRASQAAAAALARLAAAVASVAPPACPGLTARPVPEPPDQDPRHNTTPAPRTLNERMVSQLIE